MTLYDMMMNPDVPMEDIVVRQTLLGGSYPLNTGDSGSYKAPYNEEKARMTPMQGCFTKVREGHLKSTRAEMSRCSLGG